MVGDIHIYWHYKMERGYLLDLPFELVVEVIEKMNYVDIVRLCQTSKEFHELCSNDIISAITERKRRENGKRRVASLMYSSGGDSEIDFFFIDPTTQYERTSYIYIETTDIKRIRTIISKISKGEDFYDAILGTDVYVSYMDKTAIISNKDSSVRFDVYGSLFLNVMKKYEDIVKSNTYDDTITFYNDRTIGISKT